MNTVISRQKGRPGMPDSQRSKIIDMYNQNQVSCKEIAKACSVSESTVFRIVREEREKQGIV